MHEIILEFKTEFVRNAIVKAIEELNTEGYRFSYTRESDNFNLTVMATRPEDFFWLGQRSSFAFKELVRNQAKK